MEDEERIYEEGRQGVGDEECDVMVDGEKGIGGFMCFLLVINISDTIQYNTIKYNKIQ